MEVLKVIALSVLQGITEFLPISSSGHLVIANKLLGLDSPGVRLEVMLHFGTLISVVVFYRERLLKLLHGVVKWEKESIRFVGLLIVGCIPAGVVYLLLGDLLEDAFDGKVSNVGIMLMLTGVVLFSLRFIDKNKDRVLSFPRALIIGIAQAVAMLPGISRSGSTIACARFLGVSRKEAADFSFLMSLPLLAAATLLELVKPFIGDEASLACEGDVGWGILVMAVVVSALTGYVAIRFLLKTLISDKFWIFGAYCFFMGIVCQFL